MELSEQTLPLAVEGLEFPPYVVTDGQRLRWQAALGIARALMGEDGAEAVWRATRTIYNDPNFTD